jgi:THO complex subunit 4
VHRAPTDSAWQHDLYNDDTAVAPSSRSLGIETGTKLYISNLDYGVSNDDIKVSLIASQPFLNT